MQITHVRVNEPIGVFNNANRRSPTADNQSSVRYRLVAAYHISESVLPVAIEPPVSIFY